MASTRSRRWWLAAVTAFIAAVLMPATSQAADPFICDAVTYDAANPDHVLYGSSAGTPVGDEKMQVDLTGSMPTGPRFVVFWDEGFSFGSDGAVIIGSEYRDTICGTSGDDWIHGKQASDRIFGFGSDNDYDRDARGGGRLGDHLFGGKGRDLVSNGSGAGLADLASSAALVGGGKGDDTLLSGDGSSGTPWVRGGVGDDNLFGGLAGSGHMLRGGAGDDVVNLWGIDDSIGLGNAGDDTLTSRWGFNVELSGNAGEDTLIAGWGDYLRLIGGGGDDVLQAGIGNHQSLYGNSGDDIISGVGAGFDQMVDPGSGDDVITSAAGH